MISKFGIDDEHSKQTGREGREREKERKKERNRHDHGGDDASDEIESILLFKCNI